MADIMDNQALVCDIGTGTMKVGFGGEDAPRAVFSSIVDDIPHHTTSVRVGIGQIKDGAESKRRAVSLNYPIEHGIVRNWDGMEKLWRRTFDDELRVDSKQHPVLFTEPPRNPKADRETMAELMFETFEVPSIHIDSHVVLAFQAGGHTSGIALHSGDGVSFAMPFIGGAYLYNTVTRMDVAGGDVTNYLMTTVKERGYDDIERETVRDMKEKSCYVAIDYEHELARSSPAAEKEYVLPDGRVLTIGGADRFRCPEALFRPSLIGKEGPGFHEIAYDAIKRCCAELTYVEDYEKLLNNIILTGGSTMLPGFADRMEKELATLDGLETKSFLTGRKKRIVAPPERRWSAWIGGSIMAFTLSRDPKLWLSKTEYEEHGPSILYEQFFWVPPYYKH